MNKLLAIIMFFVAVAAYVTPCAGITSQTDDNEATEGDEVNVVAWFSKCDTVVYTIRDSSWKIDGQDTIMTAADITTAMVTVTDSAETGYRLSYTILDVSDESPTDTPLGQFQKNFMSSVASKLIGKTIDFETDECGKIVRIINLDDVKKQAKNLFKTAFKELKNEPWMKEATKIAGFKLDDFTKSVDADRMVNAYLMNINLLFAYHGLAFDLGTHYIKHDATDTQYATETYSWVTVEEDGCYNVTIDEFYKIPQKVIKSIVGQVFDKIDNKEAKEWFETGYDAEIPEDNEAESNVNISYLPNGWPYEVIRQVVSKVGDGGEATQTQISAVAYSFGN